MEKDEVDIYELALTLFIGYDGMLKWLGKELLKTLYRNRYAPLVYDIECRRRYLREQEEYQQALLCRDGLTLRDEE